jgi:SAM-dependent methyltransferase
MMFTVVLFFTALFTFIAKVPFVPTSQRVVDQMLEAADLSGNEVVYDLGAGDGRFLISAKRRFPGVTAIGFEMVPLVWFLGKMRVLFSGQKVQYRFGNALKHEIRDANCVFLYLITSLMPIFAAKFDRELRPGTVVVSNSFPFPGRNPIKKFQVKGIVGKTSVYVYRWEPKKV